MKISVIIPAYNEEMWLPVTLDSVLSQTMDPADYEVIAVNNGSTDRTGEILADYSRRYSNVHVISQSSSTPGEGRNRGMEEAKGDYFFFLDADDLMPEDALESLYSRAVSRKADLVVAGYEIFTETSSHRVKKLEKLIRKDRIDPFDKDLLWTFSLWNKLFAAAPVREHGLLFSDLIYSEDGLFFLQYLGVCGRITGLDRTVLRYRKAPAGKQSITGSFSARKLTDYLEAHRRMRLVLKERLKGAMGMEDTPGAGDRTAGDRAAQAQAVGATVAGDQAAHAQAMRTPLAGDRAARATVADDRAARATVAGDRAAQAQAAGAQAARALLADALATQDHPAGAQARRIGKSEARRLLQEFNYKELYVLIDQFYRHYWEMDEETQRKVSKAVAARLGAIDDNGYIRTVQQWEGIDLGQVGREQKGVFPPVDWQRPAKTLPARITGKVRREVSKWVFLHSPHRRRL